MPQSIKAEDIDFSMLLASAAHDMKNSLGMLLSTLDQMSADLPDPNEKQASYFSLLRGEASRINNDLIYLLSLYRIQHKQLQAHVDEVFVQDFFEEQRSRHDILLQSKNLTLNLTSTGDDVAYFDQELINGVLNNAIVNAAKYTSTYIELWADASLEQTIIEVRDDGPGFPAAMINENSEYQKGVSFTSGSTNLGLYFCNHIAALHTRGALVGKVELLNGSNGGIFRLILP